MGPQQHLTAQPLSYFGFFFILVNGWDGTGYKRFLSIDHDTVASWTWGDAADWITGPVAITLIVMGIVILPYALGFPFVWLRNAFRSVGENAKLGPFEGPAAIWVGLFTLVFGFGLAGAIAAHVVIALAGPIVGAVLIAAAWGLATHRRGPLATFADRLVGPLLHGGADLRPTGAAFVDNVTMQVTTRSDEVSSASSPGTR